MSRLLLDGWHVVLGIETHAQIKSRQKLFSSASTSLLSHGSNTNFNAFDAAFPGTLPRINPKCVLLALRASLALNCHVQQRSTFDRKHYFYSDLPVGYQITQHYSPIALDGYLVLPSTGKQVRIKQVQMEQDTAKSIFESRERTSYIDLNRSGSGLLEIVTEPDLESPDEAAEYVRTLQATLRAVGASDGNMETGSLRCDVNVSIHRPGEPFGTRCEIKNLNSVRYIVAAINHEIERQKALLVTSQPVAQETRGFDHHRWETFKLRSKEDAPDYRYMPDPNLGVLAINPAEIMHVQRTLPLLPEASRTRLIEKYEPQGVTRDDIDVLIGLDAQSDNGALPEITATAYFEKVVDNGRRDPKTVINWILNSLLGHLASQEKTFSSNHLSVNQLGEMIDMVASKELTGPSAKLVLRHILSNPPSSASLRQLAVDMNLVSMTKSSSQTGIEPDLSEICRRVIDAMPSEVAALQAGHRNVVNKLVGGVMKETRGRADANTTRSTILSLLK
ncbi:Glutamyl-tRNA amidotransferase B subunit [Hymenopellis radicata]|nr:Glutamyl-tRNA amidotransferase B subunit [Hymenopellis radicata]